MITPIMIAIPVMISHKQPNMHPAESRILSLKLPPKAHPINPIAALMIAIQMIMFKIMISYSYLYKKILLMLCLCRVSGTTFKLTYIYYLAVFRRYVLCFSFLGFVPLFSRLSVVRSIYKNTAYAFVHTGVWHNPRKQKQKQYIPKYALTNCQLFPFISCQTYVCTDWFVSIIYVRCCVATELSADNSLHRSCPLRLQRYYFFLRYANFSLFFSKICPSHAHKHTLSRFILLSRCKGTTIF